MWAGSHALAGTHCTEEQPSAAAHSSVSVALCTHEEEEGITVLISRYEKGHTQTDIPECADGGNCSLFFRQFVRAPEPSKGQNGFSPDIMTQINIAAMPFHC